MRLFRQIERKFGRFAVPQVTLGLIVCQMLAYALTEYPIGLPFEIEGEVLLQRLLLVPNLVLQGEVWRLVTFLAVPPVTNILFAFFFWYLFYLMGTSLEYHWGAFRYNIFLLVGYLATVAASFLTPSEPSSNGYLQASVFLAFAFLYPNFELYLFFILPVKIKWLALLTWIGYFFSVVFGDWNSRLLVLASVSNFFLFFGSDVLDRIQHGRRSMSRQAARIAGKSNQAYFHRCTTCGITDRTHPTMEFRYCSQCAGSCGYCTDHIRNHEHLLAADKPPQGE